MGTIFDSESTCVAPGWVARIGANGLRRAPPKEKIWVMHHMGENKDEFVSGQIQVHATSLSRHFSDMSRC